MSYGVERTHEFIQQHASSSSLTLTIAIIVVAMDQSAKNKEVTAASSVNDESLEDAKKGSVIAHIDASPTNTVTPAEKRLVRKIDWHVLPIPILLVGLSSIDRTNIASARVAGMAADLDLGGNRYNIAVSGRWFLPLLLTVSTALWLRCPKQS